MLDVIIKAIYYPSLPFVGHPELAYLMAIGFGILFAVSVLRSGKSDRGTQLGMLFAAVLWVMFGLIDQQYAGFEMRVDVLLTWPPVFAVTLVAACFGIRGILAKKHADLNVDASRSGR